MSGADARGAVATEEIRGGDMRERILAATIACLVENGFAETSIARVMARAGATRGAHQHHFARKSEMVIQAVEFLADQQAEEVRRFLAAHEETDSDDPAAALQAVWDAMSGRLFSAALELWHAARTDAELREALVPVEHRTGRLLHRLYADVLVLGDRPGDDVVLVFCMDVMRGLASRRLLLGDEETEALWADYRRRLAAMIAERRAAA